MGKITQVNISQFRHRIKFQQLNEVSDGMGGKTTTWVDVATVWAKIEPITSRERLFSQQLEYHRTHRLWVRKASEYTPTNDMQIVFGTRIFQIKGVYIPDERDAYYKIDAEENTAT